MVSLGSSRLRSAVIKAARRACNSRRSPEAHRDLRQASRRTSMGPCATTDHDLSSSWRCTTRLFLAVPSRYATGRSLMLGAPPFASRQSLAAVQVSEPRESGKVCSAQGGALPFLCARVCWNVKGGVHEWPSRTSDCHLSGLRSGHAGGGGPALRGRPVADCLPVRQVHDRNGTGHQARGAAVTSGAVNEASKQGELEPR